MTEPDDARAKAQERLARLAEHEPGPCPHCGRIVLAGPWCCDAARDAHARSEPDDARIQRLSELAREVWPGVDLVVEPVRRLTSPGGAGGHTGFGVRTTGGSVLLQIMCGARSLGGLEAALLVLAEETSLRALERAGLPRSVVLSDAEVRIQELLLDRTATDNAIDKVKEIVCSIGQSDERIDALRLLLVGRCYVCREPAVAARAGILLCYAHQSEGT